VEASFIAAGTTWPAVINAAVLRWFQELSDQGVVITDDHLRVVGWNRWLEARTGRTAATVVGRLLTEAYPDLVERGLDQLYFDALRGEARIVSQPLHGYLLPIPADAGGYVPQSARVAPLSADAGIVGTITVIHDVSERVAAEGEYRAKIAALEVARETAELALRVKDEFLATLSHEIRTPLNAVLGWAQTAKGREADPTLVAKALEVIVRNASAQVTLVEDLLDAARIATGKMRLDTAPLALGPVVLAAIDVIRPAAAAKRIAIHVDLDDRAGLVLGDASRLQQVAWNILSNAVKFTDEGGSVEVLLERQGDEAVLAIIDTGEGIPQEFLPHVFDRFRQGDGSTSRRHGGLGLGLAVVRQIVEMHGGTIALDSAGVGQGTRVTVRLPSCS
jgi:PAS domain S-box-containing protein